MLSHVLIECTWVARRAASGTESRAASATLASRLYGRYLAFIVYLVYEYVCTCMQVFVHTHINPRYPAGVDHSPADSDGRRTERHFAWSFSVKDDVFPPSCFGGFSRHYLILQGLSRAGTPVFFGGGSRSVGAAAFPFWNAVPVGSTTWVAVGGVTDAGNLYMLCKF